MPCLYIRFNFNVDEVLKYHFFRPEIPVICIYSTKSARKFYIIFFGSIISSPISG